MQKEVEQLEQLQQKTEATLEELHKNKDSKSKQELKQIIIDIQGKLDEAEETVDQIQMESEGAAGLNERYEAVHEALTTTVSKLVRLTRF